MERDTYSYPDLKPILYAAILVFILTLTIQRSFGLSLSDKGTISLQQHSDYINVSFYGPKSSINFSLELGIIYEGQYYTYENFKQVFPGIGYYTYFYNFDNYVKFGVNVTGLPSLMFSRIEYYTITLKDTVKGRNYEFSDSSILISGFIKISYKDLSKHNFSYYINSTNKRLYILNNFCKSLYCPSIDIDPTIEYTYYAFPNETGKPLNQWSTGYNIKADDDNYARESTLGQALDTANYSFTEYDGGTLPNGSFIQSFEFLGQGSGFSCSEPPTPYCNVTISLSYNGGNTYLSSPRFEDVVFPCGGMTTKYWDLIWTTYGHLWKYNELFNDNFRLRLNYSGKTGDCPEIWMDYIRAQVQYVPGPVLNVSDSSDIVHLPISDQAAPFVIKKHNVISYLPMDSNKSTQMWPDYSWMSWLNSPIHQIKFYDTGCHYGGCYWFNESAHDFIEFALGDVITYNNITISLWFKRSNSGTSAIWGTYDKKFRLIFTRNDEVSFYTAGNDGTTNACLSNTTYPVDGKWYHVAVTFNGTQKIIYVNSTVVGSCGHATEIDHQETFYFGQGSVFYADGFMDEFMIINFPMSQPNINGIYTQNQRRVYMTGEKIYTSLAVDPAHNSLNISLPDFSEYNGTNITVQIGNSSGGFYVYSNNYDITDGLGKNLSIATPQNFSIKFLLKSDPSYHYSPSFNKYINYTSWQEGAIYGPCAYVSGNYTVNCSQCQEITDNADIAGNNFIVSNSGILNIWSNISGINKIYGNGCMIALKINVKIS